MALGSLVFQGVEGNLQIFGSRREHLEQVLVSQSVGFWFGRAGGEHDLAVLLRYDGRSGGKRRRVGTEQEVRLVLQDHAAVELLHALGIGFVVVAGKLHFVALAPGLDAAGSVHRVAPQFKPAVLLDGVDVQGAGFGDGESDGDGLLSESWDKQREPEQGRAGPVVSRVDLVGKTFFKTQPMGGKIYHNHEDGSAIPITPGCDL